MEDKKEKQPITDKIKTEAEKFLRTSLSNGIQPANVDSLFKAVDMYKDAVGIEKTEKEKEENDMRYRGYGNYSESGSYNEGGNYSEGGSYGRRMRDSRGRYMERGYDAKYRGEDMIDEMYQNYQGYSYGREAYGRGNYGAKEDTMKSLKFMMESVVDFVEMLKKEAGSQEEYEIIKKYVKKLSEM